jgi:hypothetical protein
VWLECANDIQAARQSLDEVRPHLFAHHPSTARRHCSRSDRTPLIALIALIALISPNADSSCAAAPNYHTSLRKPAPKSQENSAGQA